MSMILLFPIFLLLIFVYWRFFYFFRDPDRKIPQDENSIVSPADGTVVYVKELKNNEVPISIKNKRQIKIHEIFKQTNGIIAPSYLVGIFMHPTDVHVNRAPISGIVENIAYTKGKNFPMTMMWWRVLLGIKPYEYLSNHILENERNTILILGRIPVHIVQIADIYVNKIVCWVEKGQLVNRGDRLGMIKLGSQVDLLFSSAETKIEVKIGQKVKAGESIIATFK